LNAQPQSAKLQNSPQVLKEKRSRNTDFEAPKSYKINKLTKTVET
jgi:hypothetical protein